MGNRRGFTLTELMVVSTTTALLATLSIPSILASKLAANEASTITSLKMLATAEEQFRVSSGTAGYGTLQELSASNPRYIEEPLGNGKKSGYLFVLTLGTPADSHWFAQANPMKSGKTGNRHFFIDASGLIRTNPRGPATSADSPID
ncbi:MAG: prepilin-type N-terminal cleavage/methylation domain-containing protein [Planctomycetota bacterium]